MTEASLATAAPLAGPPRSPLLATKLYIAPARPNLVPRPRLMERLAQGLTGRLILASAPAGFGKTTLLSERLARCNCPAAWVSLDSADNDPARFLSYLIASLQKVAPGIGQAAQSLLHSPQLPPVESVLTALINDLCSLADHIILVLDDYHVIDAVSGSFGMIVAIAQEPLRVVG